MSVVSSSGAAVLAGLGPAQELGVVALVSPEGVHRSHLVGERLEVPVALEGGPGHDRGEAHRGCGLVGADPQHQPVHGVRHRLIGARPAVEAVDAGRDEESLGQQLVPERGPRFLGYAVRVLIHRGRASVVIWPSLTRPGGPGASARCSP